MRTRTEHGQRDPELPGTAAEGPMSNEGHQSSRLDRSGIAGDGSTHTDVSLGPEGLGHDERKGGNEPEDATW